MRPVSERYAKAVLPIDGRPVIATLLRELARAGMKAATIVVGEHARQIEALVGGGYAFGLQVRFARQPEPLGSADAVLRAGLEPPYLVAAADTVFHPGDVGRFAETFLSSGAAGAIGIRRHPEKAPMRVEDGRVRVVNDPGGEGPWTGAPLWALEADVTHHLGRDNPPHELNLAFQRAIDEGAEVLAIEIGTTRDLTSPLDLMKENFPYLAKL
jgi:NDP-sugar pyrophosphorylase family protein